MSEELTNNQGIGILGDHGAMLYGGTGVDGFMPVFKSEAGVTLLPAAASMRGSGALEGRNPYDGNMMGMGGFGSLGIMAGTFQVYRWMRAHPTVALARATVIGPVVAAGWGYEEVEGDNPAPEGARELVEKALEPLRLKIMLSMVRALDYGYEADEVVWGANREGYRIPVRTKELRHDFNTFQIDDKGHVTGLLNQGTPVPIDRLLVFTYDGEYGNPYGRSRLENIRRTWCNWLAHEDQRFRLGQKTAGILMNIGYPPDVNKLAPGELSNYMRAVSMARMMCQGQSVVYETTGGLNVDRIEDAIALSKGSLFPINLLDFGNTGPQIEALSAVLADYDKMLCRGYLRSERSVIESEGGGTRAESADHTANISDVDCDTLHEQIVSAVNEQIVNAILLENFGPGAVGTVRVKANGLVDEDAIVDRKLLEAALANPMAFAELFSRIDLAAWCKRQGIHLKQDAEGTSHAVSSRNKATSLQLIERFKRREFPYIVSVAMLYKGFDADAIAWVFMAKKTQSQRIYAQAMGRGTRPLREIRAALAEAAGAAERRAIIAASEKPRMTMVDLVGIKPEVKDCAVSDVLLGEKPPEVRDRVKRDIFTLLDALVGIALKEGKTIDYATEQPSQTREFTGAADHLRIVNTTSSAHARPSAA